MKKLILIFATMSGVAYGQQQSYDIYNRGEMFPSTTISPNQSGGYNVYDHNSFNPVIPVQVIEPVPGGYNIYEPNSPSGGWFPTQQVRVREENNTFYPSNPW